MPRKRSLLRILIALPLLLVAMIALFWCYAHVDRNGSVARYFQAEQYWVDHWPWETGKRTLEQATPRLVRMGFLAPAVIQVQPGVKLLLDPRDLVSVNILRGGDWQPEVWDALKARLPEGAVLLDVGAHIGYFSMIGARQVGPTGRVVSFEPNPETLLTLRENVRVNELANVTVAPIACTDKEQTLTLFASPAMNSGASSLAKDNADITFEQAPKEYSVRGRPIDDVVRELNLQRVDAIKMDIEGAEVIALHGASETLRRFHPKIVIEVVARQLENMKTTPDALFSLLRDLGYNTGKPLNAGDTDWAWSMEPLESLASSLKMDTTAAEGQLTKGFHAADDSHKRWTKGVFAATLKNPAAHGKAARLKFAFTVTPETIEKLHDVTVTAKVGSLALAPLRITSAGDQVYEREVTIAGAGAVVEFTVDHVLPGERGVIATSISLESK